MSWQEWVFIPVGCLVIAAIDDWLFRNPWIRLSVSMVLSGLWAMVVVWITKR